MALKYCIPEQDMAQAKQAIKDMGGWNAVARMTDEKRIAFFDKVFGVGVGKDMNADYVAQCLNPTIKASLKTWAGTVDGKQFNKYGMADFLKKVDSLEDLSQIGDSPFLTMLAEVRLGYRLSNADIVAISEKAAKVNKAMDNLKAFKSGDKTFAELTQDEFLDLLDNNKEFQALADDMVQAEKEFQQTYNEIEKKTTGDLISEASKLTALHKNMIGSADVSASLRQLLFYIVDNIIPLSKAQLQQWGKKGKESVQNIWSGLKIWWGYVVKGNASAAMTEARRQIVASPLYVAGTFKRAGLDIGVTEENFPSGAMAEIAATKWKDWADYIKKPLEEAERFAPLKVAMRAVLGSLAKVSGLARIAVASEMAFTTQVQLARANMFSALYEEMGREAANDYLKEGGAFVNQQTGRGASWGEGNLPRMAQAMIWSTRWISARVQQIYNLAYVKSEILTKNAEKKVAKLEAEKAAGKQINEEELKLYKEVALANQVGGRKFESSVKFVIFTAVVAGLSNFFAKMFGKDDDDRYGTPTNILSTDFMKIRFDRLHIDFTGGTAKLLVTAARLITGLKQEQTGAIVKQDRIRGLVGELENKSSPTFATLVDLGRWIEAAKKDKTAESYGVEIGSTQWFVNQLAPIPIANIAAIALEDEPVVPQVFATIADYFGLGASNYEISAQQYKSDDVVLEEQKVVNELNWENDLDKGALSVPSTQLAKTTDLYKYLPTDIFKQAQEEFGKEWAKEEEKLMNTSAYKKLPAKKKFNYLKNQRTKLMDKYTRKYKKYMTKKKK